MTPRTFHILTFGCQMNVNDSAWLGRELRRRGFVETRPETAGVLIVNTCSVREKPERKVCEALARLRHVSRNTPGAFCVAAGCVAVQLGETLFGRFPQVRLVTGGDGLPMVPDAVERLLREPDLRLDLTAFTESYAERDPAVDTGEVASAFVNIMQGCDNFCAYCIVPYVRGRQKSRRPEAVLEECRAWLAAGVREITLLGQNVNAYGLDGGRRNPHIGSFADLLRRTAELPGLERLRMVTPHPKDFGAEEAALFGELPVLCPRLHLPLQAGSDRVLARMGRRYDGRRYLELVEALRRYRPELALSTDLIVGFPGETEADFQDTLRLMREADFMASFSFCYSDRPGTAASRMPDKIPAEVKAERLQRLQALQDELAGTWLRSRVGVRTTVFLEKPASRQPEPVSGADNVRCWQGRDPWGDTVLVTLDNTGARPGLSVPVRIVRAGRHSLYAEAEDAAGR